MNNKQFKNEYGHLAGAWRGKKPIQRNVILALAHFKEIDAIDDLKEVAENDVRPEIKGPHTGHLEKLVCLPMII